MWNQKSSNNIIIKMWEMESKKVSSPTKNHKNSISLSVSFTWLSKRKIQVRFLLLNSRLIDSRLLGDYFWEMELNKVEWDLLMKSCNIIWILDPTNQWAIRFLLECPQISEKWIYCWKNVKQLTVVTLTKTTFIMLDHSKLLLKKFNGFWCGMRKIM